MGLSAQLTPNFVKQRSTFLGGALPFLSIARGPTKLARGRRLLRSRRQGQWSTDFISVKRLFRSHPGVIPQEDDPGNAEGKAI